VHFISQYAVPLSASAPQVHVLGPLFGPKDVLPGLATNLRPVPHLVTPDLSVPAAQTTLEAGGGLTSVAVSPSGDLLAAGSTDGNVYLWYAGDHSPRVLRGHTDSVLSVAFSADELRLASSSQDLTVRVWDTDAGTVLDVHRKHASAVRSIAFTHDGNKLLAGAADGEVIFCRNHVVRPHKHQGTITGVAVAPDGTKFATCAEDKIILLRDTRTLAIQGSFVGHEDVICCIAFSPNGSQLVSGSADSVIHLWDVKTFECTQSFIGHTQAINALVWPDARSCFFSASEDLTIRRWDARSGKLVSVIRGLDRAVKALDALPDSRIVATSGDGCLRIFGRSVRTLATRADTDSTVIELVACSPDGALVAACTSDATLRIVDSRTGDVIVVFEGAEPEPVFLAFSPDSSQITMGYASGEQDTWTDTYDFAHPRPSVPASVVPVAFSCDQDGWLYYSRSGAAHPATRYCWIPPERRWTNWPSQAAWAGNILAIGSDSGTLSIFDFGPVWRDGL
jgi:WD40 repeat protein